MTDSDLVSRETNDKTCACGREPRRPGQRTGRKCHARYMRMWRADRAPTPAETERLIAIAALLGRGA